MQSNEPICSCGFTIDLDYYNYHRLSLLHKTNIILEILLQLIFLATVKLRAATFEWNCIEKCVSWWKSLPSRWDAPFILATCICDQDYQNTWNSILSRNICRFIVRHILLSLDIFYSIVILLNYTACFISS